MMFRALTPICEGYLPVSFFRTAWRRINRTFVTRIGMNREGTLSADRKFDAPVSGVIMHQHKCSLCGTMWQHGEEWDRDMLAHECPVCGCHQFRAFKVDGGQTAALPEQTYDKLVEAFASADPFVRSTTLFTLNVGDRAARTFCPTWQRWPRLTRKPWCGWRPSKPCVALGPMQPRRYQLSPRRLPTVIPRFDVRPRSLWAILALRRRAAVDALTGRLSDNHPRVRTVVAAALAKIRPMTGVWQITVGQ